MARKKSRSNKSTALAPRRTSAPMSKRPRSRGVARARLDVTGPLLMSALLGFLEREGISIPHFGAVGEAGTLAVVGFVALKAGVVPPGMRRTVENIVLATGTIAVYDLVKSGNLPFSQSAKTNGDDNYIAHPTS